MSVWTNRVQYVKEPRSVYVCIGQGFALFRHYRKLFFSERHRHLVADIIFNKFTHYQITRYVFRSLWNVNGPECKT